MAIQLKCPACRETVYAQDYDRGATIACSSCRAAIIVQMTDPPPVVKPPVAQVRPVSPDAKPPVATALPLSAPIVAKPVVAKPVVRTRDPDDDLDSWRTRRSKDRNDDDRPIRTQPNDAGGKGFLIAALIGLGGLTLLGVVLGGLYLYQGSSSDTVSTNPGENDAGPVAANNPPPNQVMVPNPNAGADPNRLRGDFAPPNPNGGVRPNPRVNRAIPAGWVEFHGTGFAVAAPGKMTKSEFQFKHAATLYQSDKYTVKDGDDLELLAYELDRPATQLTTATDREAFVGAATSNLKDKVKQTEGRPLSHGPAHEFATTEVDGRKGAALLTTHGEKAFVFHIRWKPTSANGPKRRDEFFNSVRILGAENTEPDVAVGGPPNGMQPNRPQPNRPQPNRPAPVNKPWVESSSKVGFTVTAPGSFATTKPEAFVMQPQQGIKIGGKKTVVEDDLFQYHALSFDLPPDYDPILQKLLGHPAMPHVQSVIEGDATKVDGKDGTQVEIKTFHGLVQRGVSVKLGYRLFCFCVTLKNGGFQANDSTLTDRTDKFLKSIKLSFDPKTTDPYADEPKWTTLAKATGFSVLVPRNATAVNDKPVGFGRVPVPLSGKEYSTDVDGIIYLATVHTATPQLTTAAIADEVRGRDQIHSGPDKVKVNGLEMDKYELKHFFGHPIQFRTATVGKTVYTLRVVRSDQFGGQVGDRELLDKSAKFFNSFRVGAAGGDGEGSTGAFTAIASGRVKPFWASAFLPERGEFLTVGVRDVNATPPGGVLRRYSVPDFKLKATYHLPYPAHRAAADERGGKLYLASVAGAADAKMPEREAAIVTGEVQVFDLKKLTDGSLSELDAVKPTTTYSVSSQISGLCVSPSGDAVYVSGVVASGTRARRVFRGKLTKVETATGKTADLPCESPVWAMQMSADGRRLAVVERPTNAVGEPTGGGNLVLLDGPGWKRLRAVPLTGVPWDAAVVGDRAVALEAANGTGKLTLMEPDGDTREEPLPEDVRYLKSVADGRRLLVSAGAGGNSLTLYDVPPGKLSKWVSKATAVEIGGLGTVSPDGKLAVLNSGTVLDLEKSGGK